MKNNDVSSHVKTMLCPKSLKAAPLPILQVILMATSLEEISFMGVKKDKLLDPQIVFLFWNTKRKGPFLHLLLLSCLGWIFF